MLVTVGSPTNYTINYFTKSTSIPNAEYSLRLTSRVSVVAARNSSKFALENPQPNSVQSGIGLISGWACVPTDIKVRIDGDYPIRVPGGGARVDTTGTCGHSNTGFSLLVNFNEIGAGRHRIRLESSDPAFVGQEISFDVVLPANPSPFISGLQKEVPVPGFPFTGKTTTLIWQESLQNFSIKSTQ